MTSILNDVASTILELWIAALEHLQIKEVHQALDD